MKSLNFTRKLILIAFVGTLLAVLWQEINSLYFPSQESYRFGMIQTADESSYITPAEHFLETGIWSDKSYGITQFYQRPPGYGVLYLISKFILGKYAFLGIKIIQVICFFFSILLIGKISFKLNENEKMALLCSIIAAVSPMFSGFMYYTLTEGITPFLTLWTIFSYLHYDPTKKPFGAIISTAILVLVRPQLIILPLCFILFKLLKKEWKFALFITIGFIPFALWQVRTYTISNEFPGLHPIYSTKNNTLFRPSHEAMTDLFRIWESDGEKFHASIAAIIDSNFNDVFVDIPVNLHENVKPIFVEYEQLLRTDYGVNSPEFRIKESRFMANINKTTIKIKEENRILNHITTPTKSAVYLLSKSQMNLRIFQASWRGNLFIESLRLISILLINLGYIAAIVILLRFKRNNLTVIAGFTIATFFYLIYFQRLNEERYLTPFLPLLLICFVHELNNLKSCLGRSLKSNRLK